MNYLKFKVIKDSNPMVLKNLLHVILLFFSISVYSQNVGIGTDTPKDKLTVNGTIRAERNSTSLYPHLLLNETEFDYARLKFSNSSDQLSSWTLAGRSDNDTTAARFHLFHDYSGNVLSATARGRIGVNVSNPVATFMANSKIGTDPLRIQNNGNTKLRIFSNNAMTFGTNWDMPIPSVIRMETPNLFIGYNGVHVPTERLEVDGGVRIDGPIKANNKYGEAGQVLTTNNQGAIEWADVCSYKRFQGYPIPGTYQWNVPQGVSEILVELWGAGGGGGRGGGGGSGAYAKAIFSVSEGDQLTIVTGQGGNGVSSGLNQSAFDGEASSISGPGVSAAATGGKGGSTMTPGTGGVYAISLPFLSATALPGQEGAGNVTIPIYSGVSKRIVGHGGQSPNAQENYGKGDVVILQGTSQTDNPGTSGASPGGGGGGGDQFGNNGGDGYVILRWN